MPLFQCFSSTCCGDFSRYTSFPNVSSSFFGVDSDLSDNTLIIVGDDVHVTQTKKTEVVDDKIQQTKLYNHGSTLGGRLTMRDDQLQDDDQNVEFLERSSNEKEVLPFQNSLVVIEENVNERSNKEDEEGEERDELNTLVVNGADIRVVGDYNDYDNSNTRYTMYHEESRDSNLSRLVRLSKNHHSSRGREELKISPNDDDDTNSISSQRSLDSWSMSRSKRYSIKALAHRDLEFAMRRKEAIHQTRTQPKPTFGEPITNGKPKISTRIHLVQNVSLRHNEKQIRVASMLPGKAYHRKARRNFTDVDEDSSVSSYSMTSSVSMSSSHSCSRRLERLYEQGKMKKLAALMKESCYKKEIKSDNISMSSSHSCSRRLERLYEQGKMKKLAARMKESSCKKEIESDNISMSSSHSCSPRLERLYEQGKMKKLAALMKESSVNKNSLSQHSQHPPRRASTRGKMSSIQARNHEIMMKRKVDIATARAASKLKNLPYRKRHE